MAPTYTIIYESPIKPTPMTIRYPATLTNTQIRNRTDITGLDEVMTRIPEMIAPIDRRSVMKLMNKIGLDRIDI